MAKEYPFDQMRFYSLLKQHSVFHLKDLEEEEIRSIQENLSPKKRAELDGAITNFRHCLLGDRLDISFLDMIVKTKGKLPKDIVFLRRGFTPIQITEIKLFMILYRRGKKELSIGDYFEAYLKSGKYWNFKTEQIIGMYIAEYDYLHRTVKDENDLEDSGIYSNFYPFYAHFKRLGIKNLSELLDDNSLYRIEMNCPKSLRGSIEGFADLLRLKCHSKTLNPDLLEVTMESINGTNSTSEIKREREKMFFQSLGFNPIQILIFSTYLNISKSKKVSNMRIIDLFNSFLNECPLELASLREVVSVYVMEYDMAKEITPDEKDRTERLIEIKKQIGILSSLRDSLDVQIKDLEAKEEILTEVSAEKTI